MKLKIIVVLLGIAISPLSASDAKYYAISKLAMFDQTAATTPIAKTTNPYRISAVVASAVTGPGIFTSVTFIPPGTNPRPMLFDTNENWFSVRQDFASEAALDNAYPPGVYTFVVDYDGGEVRAPLTLPKTIGAYPVAPHVSNFSASQNINASSDFTLTWDRFSGGGLKDYIYLTISEPKTGNTVFASPRLLQSGYLNGYDKTISIPSGTLMPNTTYQGEIVFWKGISTDTTNVSNVPGLVVSGSLTDFTLRTAPFVATSFKLTATSYPHTGDYAGDIMLNLEGQIGFSYRLQRSQDMHIWTNVMIVNLLANPMVLVDIGGKDHCFYRAVQQ